MTQQYETNGPLNFLRGFFVVAACSSGWTIARAINSPQIEDWFAWENLIGLILGLVIALVTIVMEARPSRSFYPTIFAIVFGLLIGFVSANFFLQGLELLPHFNQLSTQIVSGARTAVTIILCYLTVSLFLKSKDEFTLLVPFVRLSQQNQIRAPKIVDRSTLIDGRIADLAQTPLIDGPLLLPRFVINELQSLAEKDESYLKAQGIRGLKITQALQEADDSSVRLDEDEIPQIEGIDQKTIELARRRNGQVITCDPKVKDLADLQGVQTLNLNQIASAMKTRALPGDSLRVSLIRPGENPGQACGFLDDGTMVIVEDALDKVGQVLEVEVTSVIQKPQGSLIFGRPA